MNIAGEIKEDGIVVGNNYDKYGSSNPVVRWIMKGFSNCLSEFVERVSPETVNEVGCGEGFWVIKWQQTGISARGSDVSSKIVQVAKQNAVEAGFSENLFDERSIYDLDKEHDCADLLVCSEVMEHLENPEAALKSLQKVVGDYLIISVPREPLWRILNIARAKYLFDLGNTPGHIQHWSSSAFISLVKEYFDVVDVKKPLPWTMLLCRKKVEN